MSDDRRFDMNPCPACGSAPKFVYARDAELRETTVRCRCSNELCPKNWGTSLYLGSEGDNEAFREWQEGGREWSK